MIIYVDGLDTNILTDFEVSHNSKPLKIWKCFYRQRGSPWCLNPLDHSATSNVKMYPHAPTFNVVADFIGTWRSA